MFIGWPAQLTASTFNPLGQYASSPGPGPTLLWGPGISLPGMLPGVISLTHGMMAGLSWP